MKIFALIIITVIAAGAQACALMLGEHGHVLMACTASFWIGLLTCAITAHMFGK